MFIAYILQSETSGDYYIGQTKNIQKRLQEHNSGKSNWTKRGIPWCLIYEKKFQMRSGAVKHEKYLKSIKKRKYLEKIIHRGVEQ